VILFAVLKRLPAGTVYATFVGIGTAVAAIVGTALFRESANLDRVLSLALIVARVIGLRPFTGAR
jgi:multidrug transporter EmrE-like cation transporter